MHGSRARKTIQGSGERRARKGREKAPKFGLGQEKPGRRRVPGRPRGYGQGSRGGKPRKGKETQGSRSMTRIQESEQEWRAVKGREKRRIDTERHEDSVGDVFCCFPDCGASWSRGAHVVFF